MASVCRCVRTGRRSDGAQIPRHVSKFRRHEMGSKGLAVRLLDRRNRDYYGGALMMAIGLSTAYVGTGYGVGTFSRMGPGFFPAVLGAMLALVGLGIAVNGKATSNAELVSDGVEPGRLPDVSLRVQARGWVCIVASVIAFVVLGKYG